MEAYLYYLRNLAEHASSNDATETEIINENKFIKELNLTVKEKVRENGDNDVYKVDISFDLAVEPTTNDNLIVKLAVADSEGNEVILKEARIAGDLTSDEIENDIEKIGSVNGEYVLSDLIINENEIFDFSLKLEGEPKIQTGVYVYAPYGGRDSSQTLVGVAEGSNIVDEEITADVCFSVEERVIETQHEWAYAYKTIRPTEPETTKETSTTSEEDTTASEEDTTASEETTTTSKTTSRVENDDSETTDPATTIAEN